MNHTLKSFTDLVHKMRLAQERAESLTVVASSTSIYKKEASDARIIAYNLGKQVDDSIKEISRELATAATAPEDQPATATVLYNGKVIGTLAPGETLSISSKLNPLNDLIPPS